MTHTAWLDALSRQLGPQGLWRPGVEADAAQLRPHEVDWRGRYQGRALALARPASVAEVVTVVQACAAQGVAIVPQGGNTSLVGGSVPDGSGQQLVLNLQRLVLAQPTCPAQFQRAADLPADSSPHRFFKE